MFCVHCGAAVTGAFCAACGARVDAPTGTPAPPMPAPPSTPEPTIAWSDEVRYDVLLANPTVRARLAEATAGAVRATSAEDVLKAAQGPLAAAGIAVPLQVVAGVAVPIFSAIGIKTQRTRAATIAAAPGTVIVRALCDLARNDRAVCGTRQFDDGCAIEAVVPSDALAWAGRLGLTIRRVAGGTSVDAVMTIPGQAFDYGKSGRLLDELFARLREAS